MVVGILDGCASDGALLIAVKEKLWQYELDSIMLTALKQDFNKILDGWNTAAKVARILVYAHFVAQCSLCCILCVMIIYVCQRCKSC